MTQDPWWESNAVAALIGTLTALVVTYVTEMFLRRRSQIEGLHSQINFLITAKNEVSFYIDKLKLVEQQLSQAGVDISHRRRGFKLPSFRLDTSLLESLRSSLARLAVNPDAVLRLTACSYEMSHLQNRLDQINAQIDLIRRSSDPLYRAALISQECLGNVQGAELLAKSTVTVFEESLPIFQTELDAYEAKLKSLKTFDVLPE